MALSMMTWRAASRFDAFLQASAGQDPMGRPWSVHSMLARSDLDPLAAAQELTDLPLTLATRQLADIIAGQPPQATPVPDASRLAAGLIGHLPRRGGTAVEDPIAPPRSTIDPQHILMAVALALSVTVAAEYLLVIADHPTTDDTPAIASEQPEEPAGK